MGQWVVGVVPWMDPLEPLVPLAPMDRVAIGVQVPVEPVGLVILGGLGFKRNPLPLQRLLGTNLKPLLQPRQLHT